MDFLHIILLNFTFAVISSSRNSTFRKVSGSNTIFSSSANPHAGLFSYDNFPFPRYGHVGWKSNGYNYYHIFGGKSNSISDRNDTHLLSDLWSYNYMVNQWKCHFGEGEEDESGSYSGSIKIGARYGSMGFREGDVYYVFGGRGFGESGGEVILGDLWKMRYNESTDGITVIYDGECVICDGNGGIVGVYSGGGQTLGSRFLATVFEVSSTSKYIFGGSGFGITATHGFMNDLFNFDTTTDAFAFVDGDNTPFHEGSYGGTIWPPSMMGGIGWVTDGELYLFGGRGMKGSGPVNSETDIQYFNVLFCYTISVGWDWLGGYNGVGDDYGYGENEVKSEYGERELTEYGNEIYGFEDGNWPGSRAYGVSFILNGLVYIFGGIGNNFYPDGSDDAKFYSSLWIFNPSNNKFRLDKNSRWPDGEGGNMCTVDDACKSGPGSRILLSVFSTEGRAFLFFGFGSDSTNTKYGVFHETYKAALGDIWRFSNVSMGGGSDPNDTGSNVGAIIAAVMSTMLICGICCLLIALVVMVLVILFPSGILATFLVSRLKKKKYGDLGDIGDVELKEDLTQKEKVKVKGKRRNTSKELPDLPKKRLPPKRKLPKRD